MITLNNLNDALKGHLNDLGLTEEQVQSLIEEALIDESLLTNDKTVIGAINELFQNVDNGKQLIADVIDDESITKDSTFTAISEAITNTKQKLVNALIAKNYPVSIDDSWNSLVSIISNNLKLVIVCTEIQTDNSSINITELSNLDDTYTINYTLIPSDTTESIEYLMDDSYIAIVGKHNSSGNTGTLKIRSRKNGETNLKLTTMKQEVNIPIIVDINITYTINVSGDYYVYFDDGETDSISGTGTITFTKPYTNKYFYMYIRGLNNEDLSEEDVEIKVTGDYGSGPVDLSNNIEFDNGEFSYYIWNDCHLNVEIKSAVKGILYGAACGEYSSYIIKDGDLYATGINDSGQLGLGDSTQRQTFTKVTTNINKDIAQIACGNNFVFILKSDGSLWACGSNTYGQLGLNNTTSQKTFVQVTTNINNDVAYVACGRYHTCIIKTDDSLWTTGGNEYGQLGNGDYGSSAKQLTFQRVTTGIGYDALRVACGQLHTVVVKKNGTVWSCGYNMNGELGQGTSGTSLIYNEFEQASVSDSFVDVSCGVFNSYLLTSDNNMYACGDNNTGSIGINPTYANPQLTFIGYSYSDIQKISAGYASAYLLRNGKVYAAGYNYYGGLGIGGTSTDDVYSFTQTTLDNNVMDIATCQGSNHMIAIKEDGTIWAAGYNSRGQLGLGNTTNQRSFVQVTI